MSEYPSAKSDGYYLCPKCRKEMRAVFKTSRDGMPYQMNVCDACRRMTGPVDRPDLRPPVAVLQQGESA